MKRLISFSIVIALLFASCSEDSRMLREALKAAGDNRIELETVLEHYRTVDNDPQKLAAAEYLIANMPAHYSYRNMDAMNDFYDKALDILCTGTVEWQRDTLREIGDKYYARAAQDLVSDVEVMTSEYLIYSIDKAFEQWKAQPWSKHLTYEEFRDWLLPYKVTEKQSFDAWRDILPQHYTDSLSILPPTDVARNTIYGAIETVRNEIHIKELDMKFVIFWKERNGLPFLSADTWIKMTYGDCRNFVDMGVGTFRSLSLPCCVDRVPLWGRNNNGHSWYVFLSDQGREEKTINSLIEPAGKQFFPSDRFPKVLRVSYTINRRVMKYLKTAKHPYKFELCEHDITDHYNLTSDIDVKLFDHARPKDKYVYIGMFSAVSDGSWRVLDFGTVRRGKAHFEKMGRNMLYIALDYDGVAFTPISNPFILHPNGDVEYITCDNSSHRSVTLKRKYYQTLEDMEMRCRLLGGRIQCSNRADFRDARTLYTISSTDIPDKIQLDAVGKYRYWRYMSADSTYGSIAELGFFDKDGQMLTGTPIANIEATPDTVLLPFDNDWLTNFEVGLNPNGNWVGMDFKTPKAVASVRIIPRSDDNDIHPGQKYELRYLSSRGIWKSLGRRTAVDNVLQYDNVPVNCLLWLKNHSGGKEERPFIYHGPEDIEWW